MCEFSALTVLTLTVAAWHCRQGTKQSAQSCRWGSRLRDRPTCLQHAAAWLSHLFQVDNRLTKHESAYITINGRPWANGH